MFTLGDVLFVVGGLVINHVTLLVRFVVVATLCPSVPLSYDVMAIGL